MLSFPMLTDEKLREIRESVDLIALISEYVPLRRQGQRYLGLCPFHQEKSPSFGVSRGTDFYYCFGCQATGDAITFLRHVEGLGFVEAVEKLAERAGIELPQGGDDATQQAILRARARRERLAEVMNLARDFFEAQLTAHPHAPIAQDELARRKVAPETAQIFHLGYAPASWDALAQHLTRKRASLDDAAELGLIARRNSGDGYYDRFRHRLMFPVSDQHGRIIAFSGRALPQPPGAPAEQDPPAKYINSPESALYKKGQALFGLSTARVAMRKHNRALLCEGNFDLIAIHQAGFAHVLAPLGTAFTLDQAKLIRRFAEEVVVVFDGDGAGRKATAAAHELLVGASLVGRAVRLPDGQDPDSYLAEHGVEAFTELVGRAPPILDFLIDEASLRVTDQASRARVIQRLAPYFAELDATSFTHYVGVIARKLVRDREIPTERHFADVRAELRRGAQGRSQARRGMEGKERGGETLPPATTAPAAPIRDIRELPERQRLVLGAMLDQPELFRKTEASRLAGLLTDSDLRAIFLVTARMLEQRGEVDALSLLEELQGNAARGWLGERLSKAPEFDLERAERILIEGLPLLERDEKNERRLQLKREIELAYKSGDKARGDELQRLRNELART
ncbi:MAG: DNA primase [Polyangiales bacterium]